MLDTVLILGNIHQQLIMES